MTDLQTPEMSRTPSQHRRRQLTVFVLLLLAIAIGIGIKYGRHYVIPKRFAIVESGKLYRAGYCEPGPLTRVIRKHKIKTILNLLNDQPDSPEQQAEEEVVQREGVRMIRIGMPGDGLADFDLLDQAADIIADPSMHPLLVHCYGGAMRTGASYAAWRMKHCGWSYDEAIAECQDYGLSPRYCADLFEHLRRYYDERIAPARSVATETRPSLAGAAPSKIHDSRVER